MKVPLHPEQSDFVINYLAEPVLIYDLKGTVIKANPRAIKDLGFDPHNYTRNDLIKKLKGRIIGAKKLRLSDFPSASALKGETVRGRQLFFKGDEGRQRVVVCSASPIRIRGKITGAVATWMDVTERALAERALKESNQLIKEEVRRQTEELRRSNLALTAEIKKRSIVQKKMENSCLLLEEIFATTAFLIAYMDAECNIIRVNEAFANVDGKKPRDYVGKNLFELYPSPEHKAYIEEIVRSGESFTFYEKEFQFTRNPDRGLTYWDCDLFPVKDAGGKVTGVIMFLVDRTASKRGRDKLTSKEKELNDSKRLSEIGRLAAIVAHELRNPLGAIRSATFNIRMKAGTPRIESNLNNIEIKILESEQIISNLLSYSRIKLPRFEAVKVSPLLNECIDSVGERFKKRKMFVARELLDIKDVQIWADPLQLQEVFQNILNNAYDACPPEKGLIEVKGRKTGPDRIEISFRDNGSGIGEEQAKRIFEPFFTTKAKGTGLGLSICKQMIELHNGDISIESKLGEGTTFRVGLLIRDDQVKKYSDPRK